MPLIACGGGGPRTGQEVPLTASLSRMGCRTTATSADGYAWQRGTGVTARKGDVPEESIGRPWWSHPSGAYFQALGHQHIIEDTCVRACDVCS